MATLRTLGAVAALAFALAAPAWARPDDHDDYAKRMEHRDHEAREHARHEAREAREHARVYYYGNPGYNGYVYAPAYGYGFASSPYAGCVVFRHSGPVTPDEWTCDFGLFRSLDRNADGALSPWEMR